ncbi:MAG TPA: hypothetical protein P5121_19730 [Caldilineaceae bacterium]|nr:hypothetical protein [Caldilineaceae bacterium]
MNKRRLKATLVLVVTVMVAVMIQSSGDATAYASDLASVSAETDVANIPNAFSYQGTLRKANGDLANGTFNITLKIYSVVTGGTALHSETFANVVVRNGNFGVVVGDALALPAGLFDNANLYIGLTVAPDAEMLPRQRLFPVPWAMQADAAKTAITAQTANQLLNNTATNLILNRGSNNGAALAISSSADSYGAGMTMANTTGNVTYGMYVGADAAWHFANTGGNQELLKFNNGDNNAYFTGKVHAAGFNGMCFTWPLLVTDFYQVYCNQDVAETFATDERSEPGDLMVLIPEDRDVPAVRLATQGTQEALVGVVSTNPGLVFDQGKSYFAGDNSNLITDKKTAVAMIGRVPAKFSLENGPIAVGDPLTISSTPGVAMKATQAGQIIGYAMQSSDSAQDGKLLVWLQVGFYLPPTALDALNTSAPLAADGTVAQLEAQVADLAAQLTKLSAQVEQLQADGETVGQ